MYKNVEEMSNMFFVFRDKLEWKTNCLKNKYVKRVFVSTRWKIILGETGIKKINKTSR